MGPKDLVISIFLYLRAKRNPRTVFDRYLVEAKDRGAWRGVAAGTFDLPRWLKPTHGPLAANNVRILVGRPQETLLVLEEVEREAGLPIRDVWRALRGYIHEGVDFAPYAETFRKRLGDGVVYGEGEQDPDYDLNAFGERLSKDTMDAALASAQEGCGGEVTNYTIGPEFPTVAESRGRHVIKIQCVTPPADLQAFAKVIDEALQHPARQFLRPPIVRLVRDLG